MAGEKCGLELFGTTTCPHTAEMREDLEWRRRDFTEHRVDEDPRALERMLELTGGRAAVPVLVEDGEVVQIGWQGRSCAVYVTHGPGPARDT